MTGGRKASTPRKKKKLNERVSTRSRKIVASARERKENHEKCRREAKTQKGQFVLLRGNIGEKRLDPAESFTLLGAMGATWGEKGKNCSNPEKPTGQEGDHRKKFKTNTTSVVLAGTDPCVGNQGKHVDATLTEESSSWKKSGGLGKTLSKGENQAASTIPRRGKQTFKMRRSVRPFAPLWRTRSYWVLQLTGKSRRDIGAHPDETRRERKPARKWKNPDS